MIANGGSEDGLAGYVGDNFVNENHSDGWYNTWTLVDDVPFVS